MTENIGNTRATTRENAEVIATYRSYAEAQKAVDTLSDKGFEVARVQIVGRGLHSVEQVTGRMTKGKSALYGAGSGAWFGLMIALLLGIFLPSPAWLNIILLGVAIGAFWGALFGFFAHWATGGKRDFSSVKTITADEYSLVVEPEFAQDAVNLLMR